MFQLKLKGERLNETAVKKYIETQLKTLKSKGDKVNLVNVYPALLEDIIGDFTPYDLNGYDCDYFAITDKYGISGCMRFGTAEITLIVGQSQPDKPVDQQTAETSSSQAQHLTIDDVPEEILANLKTFYFTFGYGQRFEGKFQPIIAKDKSSAHNKMLKFMELSGRLCILKITGQHSKRNIGEKN